MFRIISQHKDTSKPRTKYDGRVTGKPLLIHTRLDLNRIYSLPSLPTTAVIECHMSFAVMFSLYLLFLE